MKVVLTFKSGAQVGFRAKSITTRRNALGGFTSIEWVHKRFGRRLHTVEPDQIVAITTRRPWWRAVR
jgi:hypothetical protein